MPLRSAVLAAVTAFTFAALAVPAASAQVGAFGQNKIQYRQFEWQVLEGDHVDVYFYPEAEEIARLALAYAEESHDTLALLFNHVLEARVPLIVYASHTDFEQTNILPFVPPEGILGVTEFAKRRVAVPFGGSYVEFRHTIRHELVHVFELSVMARQAMLHPRTRRAGLPLWWSEGLAEHFSAGQDTRDDMILRELTLAGRVPTIDQLSMTYSPIVYPVGGDLHRFLGERSGSWRITLLYESLWKHSSFSSALQGVYGVTTDRLTEEWHEDLRRRYFPLVTEDAPLALSGRTIAPQAVKPATALAADGSVLLAFLSPRSGYTNIYLKPLDGGGEARVAVHGERTPEFESLHISSSRLDARDGVLLFSSRHGDRDAVVFWDIERERVVGRYQFDDIVQIVSPAWSPDGERVAFSGVTAAGITNLYLLDLPGGTLTPITNDRFSDLDPTWLPDGESVVFSSDRATGGEAGARNLFRLAIATGAITPLTAGPWIDEAPRWDDRRGRVLFSSDRDGTFAIYSVDTLGSGRLELRVREGLFDPAPVPGDARIIATAFHDLSWSVHAFTPPVGDTITTFSLADTALDTAGWEWDELSQPRAQSAAVRRYEREYSLDIAAGGTGLSPGSGVAQGAQIILSDMLGDHSVALSLALFGAADFGELLSNINGDVFYLNQTRRLNWGVGAFRLSGLFVEADLTQIYREQTAGVYGALRYPISRYTRLEAQARLEHSTREDFMSLLVRGPGRREGILASNFVSFVQDNSLWSSTGPIDGRRLNLTGGVVSDITHGSFESWIGSVDARQYIRTSQQSAFALRGFGYFSAGTRPRAVAIGGTWMLRGYPRFSVAGTRAWLINTEWRFPVTDFVTVGFPFGAIQFPELQGAFFADAGQARHPRHTESPMLGSAGLGLRMALVPGFVFRLDMGRRLALDSQFRRLETPYYRQRFVDFFFGYNY
jgi:WD40 repeat protein